jgi:hypothetical protein
MSKIEVDAIEPQSGTTLTIGASGDIITIPAGSAAAPVITTTGDTNTGIFFPAADTIAFTEGGAEAMRIDSAGDVGIGTSDPKYKLHVRTSNDKNLYIRDGYRLAGVALQTVNNAETLNVPLEINADGAELTLSGTPITFTNNGTERMRIDSSGNVGIGTTTDVAVSGAGTTGVYWNGNRLSVAGDPASHLDSVIQVNKTNSVATNNNMVIFALDGVFQGDIDLNAGAVRYNTTSDYRLKENVNYDFDATTRLKQLKPARFNFINYTNNTIDGFLAHEVQTVVPEAISGTKDATETKEKVVVNANGNVIAENIEQADWENGKIADENGNTKYPTDSTWEATKVVPVYQGIDQAKLVPLLVKTIQELEARITALENA